MINLSINIKQLGNKNEVVTGHPYKLPKALHTVGEVITYIVQEEIKKQNDSSSQGTFLEYLAVNGIQTENPVKKMASELTLNNKAICPDHTITTVLGAFEEGLIRLFRNEVELISTEQPARLNEGDQLTLIQLTVSGESI